MRVLIVEDNPVSALVLQRTLERLDHVVTTAADGLSAWALINTEPFEVVISDWNMPRMDGLELTRRVRERENETYVYVILLTGRDRREDRKVGMRAGADDFLVKPPDPDELANRLEVAQRILSMQAELVLQRQQLREANARLEALASTDALTGLSNRRRFRERLEAEMRRATRYGTELSVVLVDVDAFKQFNDTYGHPAGDTVLRQVGALIRAAARESDAAARYGGEEFALILPQTPSDAAVAVAERIRQRVERRSWSQGKITLSAGVATCTGNADTPDALVERADRALYRAKFDGRNRTCVCDADAEPASPRQRLSIHIA